MGDRLIFQLGTNNWQRGGEFAPGSGILHEAHHHAYNALPGVRCYSMYPSRRQRFRDEDVRVFALDHDIPICESVSPVSSYRWHSMSEAEVAAYRQRLTDEVADWMDEIEARTGDRFELAIAHHAFMNTVVMRDVIRRRAAAGRGTMPLLCFAHGTELKMYANERRGDQPEEFPLRFLPFMQREKIFDYADPEHGVDVVAAISAEQIEALLGVFPEFPRERVVLSPNGYNQHVFRRLTEPTDVYADRASGAGRVHHPAARGQRPGSPSRWRPPDGFDAVVAFCGKFADWKRLDALLRAAAIYERARAADPHPGDRLRAARGAGPDAGPRRRARPAPDLLPRAAAAGRAGGAVQLRRRRLLPVLPGAVRPGVHRVHGLRHAGDRRRLRRPARLRHPRGRHAGAGDRRPAGARGVARRRGRSGPSTRTGSGPRARPPRPTPRRTSAWWARSRSCSRRSTG